ncbi:N-acetylneuraminate synthase [Colwellia sp. M166]|uniref:N-acetylneuraminate synthase n=1 Tax=Colwellia sp. M166 TaxID=2583805 RepID=UPI00211DF1DD|nr:N-acetylneuraminate synthase [Colwellia sp. M166]UUO23143.1 N-acetylneuraminate synthase [Colwellia sp. M166]|tara:strand:- start:15684 stop:16778 length:1095 start_codon:yes stop_codon:yes gene_type:complete
MDNKVLIIAEAGVNHNGDESKALALVDAAVLAGVDVVKFQTFKAENLVTATAKQASYQSKNIGKVESQLQMLKRLELSFGAHQRVKAYCDACGIAYLSTAFDDESLAFLVEELNLKQLKIPSGELTNAPFVLAHALTGCQLILSTGMATLSEVKKALEVIAFGLLQSRGKMLASAPNSAAFSQAFHSELGQRLLQEQVTLLHCSTEYPTPAHHVNMLAMDSLKNEFLLAVGYSDHSQGITIPIATVARGAKVIEKHFTLDRNLPGPDHRASLEPDELSAMVKAIREVESAFGDGIKQPTATECQNMVAARKSLVAASDIKQGDVFTKENLAIKRPGNGMSPDKYWALLGKSSVRDYQAGDLLTE